MVVSGVQYFKRKLGNEQIMLIELMLCNRADRNDGASSQTGNCCVGYALRISEDFPQEPLFYFDLNRLAFVTTVTEDIAIAAPAIIGLSNNPKAGYNRPAATGMARVL